MRARQIHLFDDKTEKYYSVMVKPNRRYGNYLGRELIKLYSKRKRQPKPQSLTQTVIA